MAPTSDSKSDSCRLIRCSLPPLSRSARRSASRLPRSPPPDRSGPRGLVDDGHLARAAGKGIVDDDLGDGVVAGEAGLFGHMLNVVPESHASNLVKCFPSLQSFSWLSQEESNSHSFRDRVPNLRGQTGFFDGHPPPEFASRSTS